MPCVAAGGVPRTQCSAPLAIRSIVQCGVMRCRAGAHDDACRSFRAPGLRSACPGRGSRSRRVGKGAPFARRAHVLPDPRRDGGHGARAPLPTLRHRVCGASFHSPPQRSTPPVRAKARSSNVPTHPGKVTAARMSPHNCSPHERLRHAGPLLISVCGQETVSRTI